MFQHGFIFSPGTWIGEGKISLSMVEEELFFHTNWAVQTKDVTGKVASSQDIQIQGLSEVMRNELTFYDFDQQKFMVDMENQNVGKIIGTGIYDDKMIGWEFRSGDNSFEGFETYTLQPDGSYHMRGEYVTADQFRTQIEAKIFPHSKEVPQPDESEEEGP